MQNWLLIQIWKLHTSKQLFLCYTAKALFCSWQTLQKFVRFHYIALLQLLCKFLEKNHVNTKFCLHHCIPKIRVCLDMLIKITIVIGWTSFWNTTKFFSAPFHQVWGTITISCAKPCSRLYFFHGTFMPWHEDLSASHLPSWLVVFMSHDLIQWHH